MGDYYTLLGVDRYVSQEALRHAYRRRILAMHPDHNSGSDLACARAREIIEAYRVLSNPIARRDYDFAIGYPSTDLVAQVFGREPLSLQWIPKLMLILVFFGMLAGLTYGTSLALGSRSMVFRPHLDAIDVSPTPVSPTILGRPIPEVGFDNSNLVSDIISLVCVQTAVHAETEAAPASGSSQK